MKRTTARSLAPDHLEAEQVAKLRSWASERHPFAVARLEALVEACLTHHRAVGTLVADPVALVRTWIARERGFNPSQPSENRQPAPFVAAERREPHVTPEQMREVWDAMLESGSPLAKRMHRPERELG